MLDSRILPRILHRADSLEKTFGVGPIKPHILPPNIYNWAWKSSTATIDLICTTFSGIILLTLGHTYMGDKMRNKIKRLAILTTVVVVVLSVLGAVKYLDIQPKHIVSSLTLIVSTLTHFGTQLYTYLNSIQFLSVVETTSVLALILLLIILRASMLRRVTR